MSSVNIAAHTDRDNNALHALYPGEVLDDVIGHPCIWTYKPAAHKTKPLVIFVPGGMHLARIAYGGHTDHRQNDFLATWLNDLGFSFVGISYPLESSPPIMPPSSPSFDISSWGLQAAQVTKRVVDTYDLAPDLILMSWSMGGRIPVPYCKAAGTLGLNVKLYVPLSATPGIAKMQSRPMRLQPTLNGYALLEGSLKVFLDQMREQEELNGGDVIIPEETFKREYHGATPVGITGYGFQFDAPNTFIDDCGQGVLQSDATAFAHLPWIAPLYPSSQLDARHALSDQATWGFMLVQKLTMIFGQRSGPSSDKGRWKRIVALIHGAPQELSTCVEGNHYFFLGEKGARQTAQLLAKHFETSMKLERELKSLLDQQ